MSSSTFSIIWIGAIGAVISVYYLAVTGRLYCAVLFLGHAWSVLKEEVARPVKVVKEALIRKDMELDEHEEHLS